MIDYDKVDRDYARHRQAHPEVLRALCSDGAIAVSSKVLEVGCGTGNYVFAVTTMAGCGSWAIDPSVAMLGHAHRRGISVQLTAASAEALPFADHHFDLVFSIDVIHHVGDRSAYFEQAHRVLAVDGRLCTVTDSPSIIRSRLMAQYFPDTVPADMKRYAGVDDLEREMTSAGFGGFIRTVVEAPYLVTDLGPFRDRAYSVLHLIDDGAHCRGLDRMAQDLSKGPIRGMADTCWPGRSRSRARRCSAAYSEGFGRVRLCLRRVGRL